MDIFADALNAAMNVGDDLPWMQTMAPSPDITTGSLISATSSMEPVAVSDDEDDSDKSTQSPMAPSQDGKSAGKRPAGPKQQGLTTSKAATNKRIRVNRWRQDGKKKHFSLEAVKGISKSEDVRCIFVEHANSMVPVPLWSQYIASWRDADFGDSKWIVVSNYERWVMQVVDTVTSKSVRQVAKAVTDKVKTEFATCLAKARRSPHHDNNPFKDDTDDDEAVSNTPTRADQAVLEIDIGGFKVRCMNHALRMVMEMDDAAAKFISDWFVPLVRQVARSQGQEPSSPETDANDSPESLAEFHFSVSATPNLRDKVQWNPLQHSWEILVKKPTRAAAVSNPAFVVDPELSPVDYEEAKVASYHRAIAAWNSIDGTKRHRIPVALSQASDKP